jgi:hypothetical protein
MSAQLPLASYWLAAAESGFAHSDEWKRWADSWIAHADDSPTWVLDLSISTALDDLWRRLAPQIDWEVQQGFDRDKIHEAVLGYLWLRFERGDIDLRASLELAGRHADAYDTSAGCEAFFALLDLLEAGQDVRDASKALFRPFQVLAVEQWAVLASYCP